MGNVRRFRIAGTFPTVRSLVGVGLAITVMTGQPATARAQDTAACATVDQFGLRRFEQYKSTVAACDAAVRSGGQRRRSAAPDGAKSVDAGPAPVAAPGSDAAKKRGRSIYVRDDRIEAERLSAEIAHPKFALLAKAVRATGALVSRNGIQREGGSYKLGLKSYAEVSFGNRLCNSEPFAKQKVGASCTVFLVAPDIVATAGHCIDWPDIDEADPAKNKHRVVFGFELRGGLPRTAYEPDEVYETSSLIERRREGSGDTLRDFALVRLDRPVPPRIAEQLRMAGRAGLSVAPETPLGVIGHPDGLPKKVSFKNRTTSIAMEAGFGTIFRAQLNTFHGNSGSPVLFYDQPDVVAGILVEGEQDYNVDVDADGPCQRTAIYSQGEKCFSQGGISLPCSEKVTKSVLIEPYLE
jgi:V8-like Glu-specific endopeptidase